MTSQAAAAALMEAWLTCGYDPALSPLSFPRYPLRELRPHLLSDGAVELTISKRAVAPLSHRTSIPTGLGNF